jgi:hypothetical protein
VIPPGMLRGGSGPANVMDIHSGRCPLLPCRYRRMSEPVMRANDTRGRNVEWRKFCRINQGGKVGYVVNARMEIEEG